MLEDRRPPANPWLPRNADFVLVRGIIKFFGVVRLGRGLWLRQLAADDAGDVDNRLGDMIFEADRAPHARDCRVNEAVESIPEQVQSLRRVLDGERK